MHAITTTIRKWFLSFLTLLSCLFFTNILFAATPETTSTPNLTDFTKPILVKQNQPEFDINLASNPTTGYSWFITYYNRQQLQLVSHQYISPNTKLVGAGGYETWHFKVNSKAFIAPQMFTIKLLYIRPWEAQVDTKPTVITVVTV